MTTFELEQAIFRALTKMGTYICFEVMMPHDAGRKGFHNERVDLLTYETRGNWRFYELKISKFDFYSKNKHTFYGDFNYFVMPKDVYEDVKQDIPPDIGVYTAEVWEPDGKVYCGCAKKAKRRGLSVDDGKLMFAFMQALSREHGKYRRLLTKLKE